MLTRREHKNHKIIKLPLDESKLVKGKRKHNVGVNTVIETVGYR